MSQFQNFKAAMRKPNMLDFGMYPQGYDLSWIAGEQTFSTVSATEAADGTRTTFTFSFAPIVVVYNGLLQFEGVAYTRSNNEITFTSVVPESGADIRAIF